MAVERVIIKFPYSQEANLIHHIIHKAYYTHWAPMAIIKNLNCFLYVIPLNIHFVFHLSLPLLLSAQIAIKISSLIQPIREQTLRL